MQSKTLIITETAPPAEGDISVLIGIALVIVVLFLVLSKGKQ